MCNGVIVTHILCFCVRRNNPRGKACVIRTKSVCINWCRILLPEVMHTECRTFCFVRNVHKSFWAFAPICLYKCTFFVSCTFLYFKTVCRNLLQTIAVPLCYIINFLFCNRITVSQVNHFRKAYLFACKLLWINRLNTDWRSKTRSPQI